MTQFSFSREQTSNMARQKFINSGCRIPITPPKPTRTVEYNGVRVELQGKRSKTQEAAGDDLVGKPTKTQEFEDNRVELQCHSSTTTGDIKREAINISEGTAEDSGRERLKRHRVEVAGRVWIPEIWGQEELLKDWIDSSAFNASLVPSGIMSARAALIEERRRANSSGLRIENRC